MTTNTNAAPDLKTVINFLMGDGPLNGFQFGETPEGAGKYWWRKHLRAALATAAAAVPAIPDAITHTIQRALVKFSDSELERLRTLLEPENAAVAMFGMARIAAQQNIDDADAALNWLAVAPKAEPVQRSDRAPLTETQLRKLHHIEEFGLFCDYDEFEQIARAIEAAHGIKPEKEQSDD